MLPESLIIVEDEVLIRRFLKSVAEKLGIRVIGTCDNGQSLLEMVQEEPPHMILMDINLNGAIDGLQTVRQLYQQRRIPIVFVTAYADDETLGEAMALSPYGFVAKPVTPKALEIALHLACVHACQVADLPSDTLRLAEGYSYTLHPPQLHHDDAPVVLAKKEQLLLELLAKHPGQSVPSSELERALWPDALPGRDALPSLVKRLRQKTSRHLIATRYGDGYALSLR